MEAVRVIPCLDLNKGRVVKGVNFLGLKDVGDPAEIAERYCLEGADEIVFLDITATAENRPTLLEMIKRAAKVVTVPLAVGGGIRTTEDFEAVIKCGASKVSINTAAFNNPDLITKAAKKFGKNAVVVAIDTKTVDGKTNVFLSGGNIDSGVDAVEWAVKAEKAGAGELLVTSMNCDGVKNGYDNATLAAIKNRVSIPVVASGGAGKLEHFSDAVKIGKADAVLSASLFHFKEFSIKQVKDYLASQGIKVRK